MHIPDQESRGHISPTRTYFLVGGALLVLTVITYLASLVHYPSFAIAIVVAIAIATVKAFLVLWYFMHMKYEDKLVWMFGIGYPLVLFAILLGFQVLDVPLRRKPEVPRVIQEQTRTEAQNPTGVTLSRQSAEAR